MKYEHKMDKAQVNKDRLGAMAPNREIESEVLDEELFENLNASPLGRLLRMISYLPEIRQEKVVQIRRKITNGEYDQNVYLDEALDRVLEEMIGEN